MLIIFDQSTVSEALLRIGDDWIIADLLINIIFILIHGEPAITAEYWREASNATTILERTSLSRKAIYNGEQRWKSQRERWFHDQFIGKQLLSLSANLMEY